MKVEIVNQQSLEFVRSRVDIMKKYIDILSGVGIQHFHYIKVFCNGRYIHLVDDKDYAEFYIKTIHDVNSHFISLHKEGYREYIWPQDNSDDLLSALQHYNIANGFSVTRFSQDYYEAWNFAAVPENTNMTNTYINHIDELRKFISYFNISASFLIQEAHNALALYQDYSFNLHEVFQKKDEGHSLKIPFVANGQEIKLTKREKECLKGICQGLSAKEIARNLCINWRTVESYIQSLYLKLNINTRSQAAHIYYSQQWINE